MILVINSGSSSLKIQLADAKTGEIFCRGVCEPIGTAVPGTLILKIKSREYVLKFPAQNHEQALNAVLEALMGPDIQLLASLRQIQAVGHRVLLLRFLCRRDCREDYLR